MMLCVIPPSPPPPWCNIYTNIICSLNVYVAPSAPDDIPSFEQIKLVLRNLQDIRRSKLEYSLKSHIKNQKDINDPKEIKNFLNHLEIPNLAHWEKNQFRNFMTILQSKLQKFEEEDVPHNFNDVNPFVFQQNN
jgi:hypothetical protein